MREHVKLKDILCLATQDDWSLQLIFLELELPLGEPSRRERVSKLLLVSSLALKDISKLRHKLVGLSVFASLAEVVVSEELIKDALVGALEAASVVRATRLGGQVVVAHCLRVADILHVVGCLDVVLNHFFAALVHFLERHVFKLDLGSELELVENSLAQGLQVDMTVLGVFNAVCE
eukprot:CAMPEP_0185598956 /NCGR_PEP_ID=MMETSP0434-20130131/82352_1 /TAXON_ID=626734 ORGANISM="Favella taraikaensis, Strain Fe Narragansett Bay" /NCGR_SAMPLE_ID=MMETSP0434 /ASSEMBLY_ACC=CAM_ASM_000379 /LENGTH=176 /DNA_ID=CAMNT_0028228137 /DNA_START=926 /DNA_END=1456 /DNA_ORIENTATION=+